MSCDSMLCECGREHRPQSKLLLGTGSLDTISSVLGPDELAVGRVMVVMDRNTREAAGERVAAGLEASGGRVDSVVLANPHDTSAPLEPDADQVFRLMEAVEPATRWIVSVGSGSITDLSRFVAYRIGASHAAVATAASMDGYTSSVAPLIYRGFKRTYPSSAPEVVIADTDVMSRAPARMTAAGFGDLVGKLTANADWLVAHNAFGEYRCPKVWAMLDEAIRDCSMQAEGLSRSEPAVIESLAKGLLDSGIAIMYVGNSRPASGAEHLLSHAWEMMSLRAGVHCNLHGAQVGVATVLVARLYEKILALEPAEVLARANSTSDHLDPVEWARDMEQTYGAHAAAEAVRESGSRDRSDSARVLRIVELAHHWNTIRAQVRAILPDPMAIESLLWRSGAAATPDELGLPREWVVNAFRTAHNLRNRYTALNLAQDLRILDEFCYDCL